jgi:hypothetical protein
MKSLTRTAGKLLVLGAALLLANAFCLASRAEESYYVIVYGAQRTPNVPRFTHSFATFVKATGEGADKTKYKIEEHTISWIAKTKDIVVARAIPEPGVNLSLKDSMELAASQKEKVSMWGPFEIKKELYDRALKQIDRLESNKVEYKAIDLRFRPERAINCIHAVSDIDAGEGLLETGTASGDEASRMVVEHLRRWMIKPENAHNWVSKRIGLDDYTLTHRKWDE